MSCLTISHRFISQRRGEEVLGCPSYLSASSPQVSVSSKVRFRCVVIFNLILCGRGKCKCSWNPISFSTRHTSQPPLQLGRAMCLCPWILAKEMGWKWRTPPPGLAQDGYLGQVSHSSPPVPVAHRLDDSKATGNGVAIGLKQPGPPMIARSRHATHWP